MPTTEVQPIQTLTTATGERFCALGSYPPKHPGPTLFVFAADAETTLQNSGFNRTAMAMATNGALCVSIDLPCHGAQRRPNEPPELAGWRHRIEQGEPLINDFVARARSVIDHLINTGATEPRQIAAAGTSRGGLLAMHLAAQDQRISCAVGYAPVTDLLALDEFRDTPATEVVHALSLHEIAGKLIDTDIWLCVGHQDRRIDERRIVRLASAVTLAAAAKCQLPRIELHRYDEIAHVVPPSLYDQAADWLTAKLGY